jgi:hypothetical protein
MTFDPYTDRAAIGEFCLDPYDEAEMVGERGVRSGSLGERRVGWHTPRGRL